AFVFYAVIVAMAVATLSEVFGELQRAAGATERLMELLEEESSIRPPASPRILPLDASSASIDIQNLSFFYPSRPGSPALKNLSLQVPAGRSLALVGPSGAGKSTVFELLERFYDPSEGRICVGGIDIRELEPAALRQQIALVPQQ